VAAGDAFAQLFEHGADGNGPTSSATGLVPVWLAALRAQPTQAAAVLGQ